MTIGPVSPVVGSRTSSTSENSYGESDRNRFRDILAARMYQLSTLPEQSADFNTCLEASSLAQQELDAEI